MNIGQSYIQPSSYNPFGGFTISIINDYCLTIYVLFQFPNGGNFRQTVGARSRVMGLLIPHALIQGALMHITVHDHS
jgi:hypothetical protein